MNTRQQDLIGMDEAAALIGVSKRTLMSWLIALRKGDRRYHGLPFTQIAAQHPIKFRTELLLRWYNNKTNLSMPKGAC